MNEEERIKISIVSNEGDTLMDLLPDEALAEIKDQVKNHGKWLYEDGDFVNVDELTEEDLYPDRTYIMTNLIRGGDVDTAPVEGGWSGSIIPPVPEKTPYRTLFKMTNLEKEDYDMSIDINSEQKMINIELDDPMSTIFIRNRAVLHNILRETLLNLSLKEAKNIQDRLMVGSPIRITENSYNMRVVVDLVEDAEADILITFDVNDNTIFIDINEDRRFKVFNRRDYITELFLTKLNSAATQVFGKICKAVNI